MNKLPTYQSEFEAAIKTANTLKYDNGDYHDYVTARLFAVWLARQREIDSLNYEIATLRNSLRQYVQYP
jgi:hypothetical protein